MERTFELFGILALSAFQSLSGPRANRFKEPVGAALPPSPDISIISSRLLYTDYPLRPKNNPPQKMGVIIPNFPRGFFLDAMLFSMSDSGLMLAYSDMVCR